MRYRSFKQVLAKQFGDFSRLLDKAQELRELNEIVHRFLDAELGLHCEVANVRSGCLILIVDSASWATRLRYELTNLLDRLRYEARLFQISSVQCFVRKRPLRKNASISKTAPALSHENAKLFYAQAAEESDADLAEALRRLAKRSKAISD